MAVLSVEEHEPAWTVYGQSEKFVRTWKVEDMLVGWGPYLFDCVDGGPRAQGSGRPTTGPGYAGRWFSPAEAVEYVSALLKNDAPGRLVTVASKELAEPVNPVLKVTTTASGGSAIPAVQGPMG
ncbi:hypothetical protein ACIQJT_37760 [Streptomyces sp. NPDC091972]|uniref:hypothetical protein n=1 Tax=Streptomyces sp. NPDC091972 TaxID=3366007 RepID=UPI0038167C87